MKNEHGIILLAAGGSSRMGQSKQLLSINGTSLLLRSAEAAVGAGAQKVVVVLGAAAAEHQKVIRHLPLTTITNQQWEKGMGGSLKTGLDKLLDLLPEVQTAIVMVCDQPAITVAHLNNLKLKYEETKSRAVASSYANTTGVPVLFEQSLFLSLYRLGDESGAKKILSQYSTSLVTVDFPGGETDLDTPEDYQKYLIAHNL